MSHQVLCGCSYQTLHQPHWDQTIHYLPSIKLEAHTTILSTASRTTLTQTFSNPSPRDVITKCTYTFPLYDGVSVVSFTCRIGSRILHGLVKEKNKARAVYTEAISRGETAGLLEQLPEAADVFSTRLGNIPAGEKVVVEITYVGELKHDAETDGTRFTLPTGIAPRYGFLQNSPFSPFSPFNPFSPAMRIQEEVGIKITVDATVPEGSFIRSIQSPTHPVAVTIGTTSMAPKGDPAMHRASATLSLGTSELDKDFVLIVLAKDTGVPTALLETHRTIKDQRALMVTLVPKFSLPPSRPEIIFVVDRSGSMQNKIPTLKSAMKVFLKSLPVGVKFNICSFGNQHSFLWMQSKPYGQTTLHEAISHVEDFSANYGGTQTYAAMVAAVESRFKDLPCEVMLLTDGEIWNQQELFTYLDKETKESKGGIRVFALGIGNSVSHALVEGIARAGNGFAQSVGEGEKLDSKVVRMLKGGLSPHVTDYTLEVHYEPNVDEDEEYEMVEKVTDGLQQLFNDESISQKLNQEQKPISLFDPSADIEHEEICISTDMGGLDRYAHLPTVVTPKLLQSPSRIPPLFPFTRTTVYLLMSPQALQRTPKTVVLRGTSPHGPLELSMPVQVLAQPGETLHQLAAKKAIQGLEEGRGWIFDAKDESGLLIKDKFPGRFDEIVEREGVKLGVEFQVGGKWCSFVAVEANDGDVANKGRMRELVNQQQEDTDSSTASDYSPHSIRAVQHDSTLSERQAMHGRSMLSKGAVTAATRCSARRSSRATTKSVVSNIFGGAPSLFKARLVPTSSTAPIAPSPFGQLGPLPSSGLLVPEPTGYTPGFQQGGMQSGFNQAVGGGTGLFGASQQSQSASAAPSAFGSVQSSNYAMTSSTPFAQPAPPQAHGALTTPVMGSVAPSLFRQLGPLPSSGHVVPQQTGYTPGFQQGGMKRGTNQAFGGGTGLFDASQQSPSAPAAPSAFGSIQKISNSAREPSMWGAPTTPVMGSFGGLSTQQMQSFGGLNTQQMQSFGGLSTQQMQLSSINTSASGWKGINHRKPAPQQREYLRSMAMSAALPFDEGLEETRKPTTDEAKVHRIIELQHFEGCWDLTDEVADILGFDILQQLCGGKAEASRGKQWATLLVVTYLEAQMAAFEDVWDLIVEKAKGWLEAAGGVEEGWEDDAKDLVAKIGRVKESVLLL